ncbi:hypothetical protein NDU88_008966 [Pleurodeles waltl]|uniref:Uncharacterized protein n=1 Tax=Pleurodeles waltl TaxID=8319 RepID=A0AAV7P0H0_PLEWA|nr:hypothetical protein NDU88_008966 [Pleurodeles waltl]
MPPKGVKAALLAGRGKPIRTSTTTRPGASAEVKLEMKRGLCEKMNAKIKTVSLDRFLEKKKKEGAQSEIGTVASFDTAEQPEFIETIYQSIMEHREESKIESRRTQLACRKMQTQIRRVAKTCSGFVTRMEEAETRISRLEDDVGSQNLTRDTMEKQLEDTQSKLTDSEDRLRRNNLRVLGIPEGVEGPDPRGFVDALFKEAFPDLNQWEWEREIQRAHRFPFNRAGKSSTEGDSRQRAMLISLLNFQARQAVFDLARPNCKRMARGCDFFVRPDFCHSTVKKRWRLHQLIQPLHNKGAQAFLINPAKLKMVVVGRTQYSTTEVKARDFVDGLDG